jgi:hypothetical protein
VLLLKSTELQSKELRKHAALSITQDVTMKCTQLGKLPKGPLETICDHANHMDCQSVITAANVEPMNSSRM